MSLQSSKYQTILNGLKDKIRQARYKAALTVNAQLLAMYWEIGNTILTQQKDEGWGTKVIGRLAKDLKIAFPDMRGLSERNLVYMQTFASSYPNFPFTQGSLAEIANTSNTLITQGSLAELQNTQKQSGELVQSSLAQLSWYHHITLLSKVKDIETRLFYIKETIQNGWSRNIMVHQIESGLHNRKGKIVSNFKNTIAPENSELVQQLFKDPYKFEFIYLGKEAKERDLEDALTNQLTKFLLELGQYFSFMGRQYKLMLGEKEYFFDLLFYHTRLKRYIVIDLKIDEFKPEYKGKMEFYLNLADEHLKQADDEKSIGLILCKTKDGLVAEYALRDSTKPIGIAEYKINELLPDEIRGELPTIEELEKEMEEEYAELLKPVDKKIDNLKQLIKGLKQPPAKEKRNATNCLQVFTKVVVPLKTSIAKLLEEKEIAAQFEAIEIMVWTDNQGHKTDKEIKDYIKQHKEIGQFRIELRLNGFMPAGTKAFNIWKDIYFATNTYNYTIALEQHSQTPLVENLYHQLPNAKEFESITDQWVEAIVDNITQQLELINKQRK